MSDENSIALLIRARLIGLKRRNLVRNYGQKFERHVDIEFSRSSL